jgi:hypothetical protein
MRFSGKPQPLLMPLTGDCANVKPQSLLEASMAEFVRNDGGRRGMPWRLIGWGGAVLLLATPFVAMQMHAEGVNWSLGDFIFAAVLFGIIGGALELAVRFSPNRAYRGAAALSLLGTLLTIWANLAVGIVGSEHNPANQWFFAALLIGIAGGCIGRFRPKAMSIAATATAVLLWITFAVAVMGPTDEPFVHHSIEFAGTTIFALLFLGSAALFRKSARDQSSSSS